MGLLYVTLDNSEYYPRTINIQKVYDSKPSDYETIQWSAIYGQGTAKWRRGYTLKTGVYFTNIDSSNTVNYDIPIYVYGTNNKALVDLVYQGYTE